MEDGHAASPAAWTCLRQSIARIPGRTVRRVLYSLAGIAALVLLLLALEGAFGGAKVGPGTIPLVRQDSSSEAGAVAVVKREIDDILEWPGTVRSRTEARPAAKLLARILELRVDVGARVKAGDVLVVLDDRDLTARVEQAKASLAAADAQAVRAGAEHARLRGLFEKEAATRRDLETAEAASRSARAQVEQARQALGEAELLRSESMVRAPFDGVVTEKWAQAGDTAVPGKPLLAVQDPRHLRIEAAVPEAWARKASLGQEWSVRFDVQGPDIGARIDEIAPAADPESRTVMIKATLAAGEGILPGMFGRLLQPCGKKTVLVVPVSAVIRSGQLESVTVIENGGTEIRHVRTGKRSGTLVEVLSGLREGELLRPGGR